MAAYSVGAFTSDLDPKIPVHLHRLGTILVVVDHRNRLLDLATVVCEGGNYIYVHRGKSHGVRGSAPRLLRS